MQYELVTYSPMSDIKLDLFELKRVPTYEELLSYVEIYFMCFFTWQTANVTFKGIARSLTESLVGPIKDKIFF